MLKATKVVMFSCMFASGVKPKSCRRRSMFLESDWNLTNLLETSRRCLPGISVEVVSPTKGDLNTDLRSIFKVGSARRGRSQDQLSSSDLSTSVIEADESAH